MESQPLPTVVDGRRGEEGGAWTGVVAVDGMSSPSLSTAIAESSKTWISFVAVGEFDLGSQDYYPTNREFSSRQYFGHQSVSYNSSAVGESGRRGPILRWIARRCSQFTIFPDNEFTFKERVSWPSSRIAWILFADLGSNGWCCFTVSAKGIGRHSGRVGLHGTGIGQQSAEPKKRKKNLLLWVEEKYSPSPCMAAERSEACGAEGNRQYLGIHLHDYISSNELDDEVMIPRGRVYR